jgi:ATP-dependent DNA helicase RecQ
MKSEDLQENILPIVRQYWGFDSLRPLQAEAIRAGLELRDSVVVMPTGGGKSLCYQVPPAVARRTDVVVSPLISLMKDQVDGLRACGYPAVALHSGMTARQQDAALAALKKRSCHLLFVSPERILTSPFLKVLDELAVRAFAIDEAHCISHWGHDFRPDYRQLSTLKERFPQASVHAFTATATQRVRQDVAEQLKLNNPAMLVGTFDRPNLTYRVVPREDVYGQTVDIIRRHLKEAVIVYCLSRKDTETMADYVRACGIEARPYHAGLSADQRRETQDAFAAEKLNVVTATVAFGMGIDRSNVRCVIHASMPKSIEHYQQETGRAGRDGLEAECVLLYSAADVARWERLIEESAQAASEPEIVVAAQMALLEETRKFCARRRCRHRALSEYFGQSYPGSGCRACDVCLKETEGVEDATVTAQKILSCVARVRQRFGVGHVVDVLQGVHSETIRSRGHDQLSTYGILKNVERKKLMGWVYQLVDQGMLERTAGDRPVLKLNEASWEVLRGQRVVTLMRGKSGRKKKTRAERESWEGVDRELFARLRDLRREIAEEESVPAFVIFSDATLREMARKKPTSPAALKSVVGVGERKLADYGERILSVIRQGPGSL